MKAWIIMIGLLSVVFLAGCSAKANNLDGFAQCLAEKDIKMYGTDWCSHCQDQKADFGDSFKKVDFVNCEFDKTECTAAGITGYPTWVIDGEHYPGKQKLDTLAELSGCDF